MQDEKTARAVLIIITLFAVLSLTFALTPSKEGYSVKEMQNLKKEAVQDQQDYAYSRIGYAQGYPPRTLKKDVAHIPSLLDKTERLKPIPWKGLDRTGPSYMTPKEEQKSMWVKKQGYETEIAKRFFQ